MTFYADMSDGSTPIKKRTLSYDTTTDTISESVIPGAGTYPSLTFTGAATTTPLLTKVEQILDGSTTPADLPATTATRSAARTVSWTSSRRRCRRRT